MATQAGKQGTAPPGPPPNYTRSSDIEATAGTTASTSRIIKLPDSLAPAAAVREYIIAVLHTAYEVPRPQAVAAAAKWNSALGAAFIKLGRREYVALFGEEYGARLYEYRMVAANAIWDEEGPGCVAKLVCSAVLGHALWGFIAIFVVATAKKC